MNYQTPPPQSNSGLLRGALVVAIICGVLGSTALGWWLYTQAREEHARQVIADRLREAAERMKQAMADAEENASAAREREERSKWVALSPRYSPNPGPLIPDPSPSEPVEEFTDAADALDLHVAILPGDKIHVTGRNRSPHSLKAVHVSILPAGNVIDDAVATVSLPRVAGRAQIDETVVVDGVKDSFPGNAKPRLRIVAAFAD